MSDPTDAGLGEAQREFLRRCAEVVQRGAGTAEQQLEQLLGTLLVEACAVVGVAPERYVEALERNPSFLATHKEGLLEIVLRQGGGGQTRLHRELERGLHLLKFELTGAPPPAFAWEGVSPAEQNKLRATIAAHPRNDPDLLAQVNEALDQLRGQPEQLGSCRDCFGRIPIQRLLAVPYAVRCAPCQTVKESGPRTESSTSIPVRRW